MKSLTARQLIQHLELGLKTLGVDDCPIILWSGRGADDEAGSISPMYMKPDEYWSVEGFYRDDPEGPQQHRSIHLTSL